MSSFFFTPRGAFLSSLALFILLFTLYLDLAPTNDHVSPITGEEVNLSPRRREKKERDDEDAVANLPHDPHEAVDGKQKIGQDPQEHQQQAVAAGPVFIENDGEMSALRRNRLIETNRKPKLDPEILEWPYEDPETDGPHYNVSTSKLKQKFISKIEWKGKCWYRVTNFCVVDGELTVYHDPATDGTQAKGGSLRMCNEFSQRSPTIRLKYRSEPMPEVLPGPLLTKTPGWVLQFWCQDLFHSTLSIMPAFHTKKLLYSKLTENSDDEFAAANTKLSAEPDIYLRIARGKRHKGGYCYIKFGHPLSFKEPKNEKWSKGKQFPFNGNPYWSMYKVLSKDPWRIHPQYGGATKKRACYRSGIIDKLYVKDITRTQAREYSDAQLSNLLGENWKSNLTKRECGKYRITIIDRQGKTRKLTNIPEIIKIAENIPGFAVVRSAKFEYMTLQEQISLISNTDLLLGVHGNGLIWQQFLQHGSCLIELVHTWYQPYAKLFGHSYFHSSIKNNPLYKKYGEFVPFAHNETEIEILLKNAKVALDTTSCDASQLGEGVTPKVFDMEEKLDYMYKDCSPHC